MSRRSRKRKKGQQSQPPPAANATVTKPVQSSETASERVSLPPTQSQPDDSWTLARLRNTKVSIELLLFVVVPLISALLYFAVPAARALFREQLRQELQHIEHEQQRADRSGE
ncbi:hypothetical protein [Sandaracinus amylolyticus]|uniref:hypothetical protein n=1 Tax=Sandaracinus amylolyticus TaxID=927083 RepID=UPI001F3B8CF1|nr:hypothetical protein [Sandaracinus amylolyticus]UJR78909.1 Hypothetical protein I5071_9420 [Sandaracinus amylolyticus]